MYMTILERSRDFGCGDFLFGFGVANFCFCRRVAFLFRVAAAYVIGGAIFAVFPPLVLVQCLVVALEGMVALPVNV